MAMDTFPIKNRQAVCTPDNVRTEILLTGYSDKILVVVTQLGKIGSLLLTSVQSPPKVLMGNPDDYDIYARCIAEAIVDANPLERRPVLLGIALKPEPDMTKEATRLKTVIKTVLEHPVW